MSYICHSGGCPGADMTWEKEGLKFGVHTIAYSFWNHKQEGKNQKILSGLELKEGFEAVMRANQTLKKYPQGQPQYVQNLLARNWFQVKNSEAVFAIAKKFLSGSTVVGGTGWAVQMALDSKKPIFVFEQNVNLWYSFDEEFGMFRSIRLTPRLPENFAGIGTRDINQDGIKAIQEIYRKNFTGQ